jgi:LAO/AO transport system ATPase
MPFDDFWSRFRQKDRLALSRLLTWVSRGQEISTIRQRLTQAVSPTKQEGVSLPRTIAITGSGGVGKSTLVGKLIETIRSNGQSVAVLACDPQSPLTGGALLGDRLRMPNFTDDADVYVRSVATPGGQQAVAEHLDLMVALLHRFGFDLVILETVGAGQGDTAVRNLADVVVLLIQPEAGDDIQWEKAGLLEVADVVVVHKADLPGADRTEAQVRSLLNLPGCREVPILRASAAKATGLEELHALILELPSRRSSIPRTFAAFIRFAQEKLAEWMYEHGQELQPTWEKWQRGEWNDETTLTTILQQLSTTSPHSS